MTQPITDYAVFFENAKAALKEASALKEEEIRLQEEESRLSRAIESEKKAVSDQIAATVKKRLAEVTGSYEEEVAADQEKLKKVRARRDRARNQGVKERIQEETMSLRSENRELKSRIKDSFAKDGVPFFCNSKLYYALYFPGFRDILTLILTIAVCFAAVPCGIYYLIPERKQYHLIIIYLLAVIIFGGLYLLIGNLTKLRHLATIKEGRRLKDEIYNNMKKIKLITKGINNDKDEGRYNLAEFDDEIAHLEQEISDITVKKQEAVNTFENVTKNIITDEINESAGARMNKLDEDYKGISSRLKEVAGLRKEKALYITDNYEMYLGKEFLNPEKIDALAKIMSGSGIANLSEAMEEYRNHADE